MNNQITTQPIPLKDKLRALISLFVEDSKFDPVTKKLIETLAVNFLKNANDDDIREAVEKLQTDIIPFILEGQPTNSPKCNCMTYEIRGHHHKESCPLYENPNQE